MSRQTRSSWADPESHNSPVDLKHRGFLVVLEILLDLVGPGHTHTTTLSFVVLCSQPDIVSLLESLSYLQPQRSPSSIKALNITNIKTFRDLRPHPIQSDAV